jgi:hypothetical protein
VWRPRPEPGQCLPRSQARRRPSLDPLVHGGRRVRPFARHAGTERVHDCL